MQNRFRLFSILAISLLLIAGSGCHAARGLGQDIKESAATADEHLHQTDAWMQEHMW
jgi:predicted small secreted protein